MTLDPRDIVTGLLSVIGAYFWYDKTRATSRLDNHQERIRELEAKQGVLETKLDGIREVLDIKFEMVLTELRNKK